MIVEFGVGGGGWEVWQKESNIWKDWEMVAGKKFGL